MSTSSTFSFIFFLLTSGICYLPSTTAITSRRSLHQPFFPVDSSPPSPPPPPSPKYPFSSSSTTTSGNSPFFPTYPSPPPPPSPASFASFPANISSLILPHSPSNSATKKLLPLAIAAIAISLLVSAVAAFLFIRRRRRRSGASTEDADSKTTYSSANTGGPPTAEANTGDSGPPNRPATASSNSTEFLYLGTIVNSRGVDASRNASRAVAGNRLDPRKLESPDLQPLPPLARQNYRHNPELSSAAEETEEEFYSPRGSLGGTESSIGAGSGSRRVFACLGSNLEDSGSRRKVESTSSSSSSSSSDSPARRSKSISLSPPVSLSPRRSQAKSPEQITVEEEEDEEAEPHYATPEPDQSKTPLLLSSQSTSPDRGSHKSVSRSSSVVSDRKRQSPSLSPLSWSTGKGLERNPDVSLRLWNISHSNRQSQSSSLHSSPSPGRSSVSNRSKESRLSSPLGQSPDRDAQDDSSDRFSLPSHSSSSPALSPSPGASPATSNRTMQMPPPVIAPQPPMTAPPPPPPPPPPPMQRVQESQSPLTPTDQPITRPPPLTPPPQPFMLPNSLSPVELLPPSSESAEKLDDATPKPKLKPLHWDKVRATSDREMVWDQLRSSSFKLNEEMIETLFVVNNPNSKPKDATPRSVLPYPNQENRVLDPKKSQNIAILLRAVNVTIEEVCEALLEGNTDTLGAELLESLLKMAPTKEEERKLKDYKDNSPIKLGPAEKFLKSVLDVPYAFKRLEAMLYIVNFESEIDYLKKSFETLEVACEELRNSRMFMKLLEAVLKTGNRMNVGTNRGDAHAFKLDTLLKLADVKGADGKTTLLHFVVQEIVRSEGARLSTPTETANSNTGEEAKCRKLGLQVVSSLTSDLTHVKKAAAMDSDVLNSDVNKLFRGIEMIAEIVRLVESTAGPEDSSSKFSHTMNWFTKMAEEEIIRIQAQESVSMSLVKEITEYFHGDSSKEEAHPFRIFMVVRDFLTVLDRVCREVGSINDRTVVSSAHKFPVPVNPLLPVPVNPMMPQVLPPFNATQRYSSSDDDSSSS